MPRRAGPFPRPAIAASGLPRLAPTGVPSNREGSGRPSSDALQRRAPTLRDPVDKGGEECGADGAAKPRKWRPAQPLLLGDDAFCAAATLSAPTRMGWPMGAAYFNPAESPKTHSHPGPSDAGSDGRRRRRRRRRWRWRRSGESAQARSTELQATSTICERLRPMSVSSRSDSSESSR